MQPKDQAAALLTQGRYAEALPILQARAPDNAQDRMYLAYCAAELGDVERAIAIYSEIIDEISEVPQFLLHFAGVLKYAGRRAESVAIYRSCAGFMPEMGEVWWGLANVKTEPFSPADIDIMRAQVQMPGRSARDRFHFHYALGLAYEQAGDAAQSFSHYAQGAAAKRGTIVYDGAALGPMMEKSRAFFTPARFAAGAGVGCADAAPIFIVGLPRAGSTLIEQILASHSHVEGTRELPEISNIVRDVGHGGDTTRPFRYPNCLAELRPGAIHALGARYIARTRIYRRTDKPRFIDKMPANWQHIGLIAMMLPKAVIIDARRDPMATCFSAFKHLFGHGVHYSYGQTELGQYYRAYAARMDHYDATLPGRIHRVHYEALVQDTEAQIRALLAHCGLEFEPQCLRFWESARAVATPSSEQVRQPIYREGLAQWRRYEAWLQPLRQALT